eukprot:4447431-Prymnesium_polylepis.1
MCLRVALFFFGAELVDACTARHAQMSRGHGFGDVAAFSPWMPDDRTLSVLVKRCAANARV